MKLDGKAVIITGGTSGIGEASAAAFAREGARVTIAGRSESGAGVAETLRSGGGDVTFVRADVSRTADIENLIKAHMEACGRLDVLFNNASYEGPGTAVVDTPEEELDRILATNFKSVFMACKLAAPIMLEAGSGSIINTTAGSAREGLAWPNLGAYIGSKGAVIAFTRALAVELSPHGIRVNSLNPGLIDTPLLRSFVDKQADPDAFWNGLTAAQLLQRIGKPEEVASAALFLASEDGAFVTGTDMLVDGGLVLG
ncbi:MAG: SDR family oxidoreductase [Gammaproteobacteria bacterium]|nr:SDR family oxidoreductase [Gammaproteobacteria bacterium]